ncbi:MAG: IS21 family transposase, partial [Myxococcales bacterium]|nr:IS21 family transposase [Myxococcales bacterium]
LRQLPLPPEAAPTTSIDEWTQTITDLMADGLGPRAIYDRIRLEDKSFMGSYWAVKRFVKRARKARGVRAEDVAIIVDTAAGEVAQVDFGYVGKLLDPEQHVMRRAWVFVMVLGHSRHMFCKVLFDQKTETWLQLHIEAFKHFGGTVKVVVPDNLKAAVIRNAFGVGEGTDLNRSYGELARHYGFKIDPTPPYSPKKKGKVESAVKYVKSNALSGRDGEDITKVNAMLMNWVVETAGIRIPGTTHKQPL